MQTATIIWNKEEKNPENLKFPFLWFLLSLADQQDLSTH